MPASPRREVADAVVLGLAAMWGTGLFLVFAPAAGLAGGWLPLAVVTAGLVAMAAGFAEADLAARYPGAGGGYRYARERLSPGLARLTGVAGLGGRVASAAAAALVFGDYVLPAHPVRVALPLIAVLGVLAAAGVRWSVRCAWVLVPGLLFVLIAVVVTGLTRYVPADWSAGSAPASLGRPATTVTGVLEAVGLMFFAFLGFSAVPSTGSGPGSPPPTRRRSRSALPMAVLAALISYLAVALALVHALGVSRTAVESAPLVAAVGGGDAPALGVLVRVGAAAATGCALFAMLGGAGGTVAAMAAHHDLPGRLERVGSWGRPWRADLVAVALSVLLAALVTPVAAVALSACAALVHYALVGLASLRLAPEERRWPRWAAACTPPLCLGLAVLLPRPESVAAGAALAVGWLVSSAGAARSRSVPRAG